VAQESPVHAILASDLDGDGDQDLLLGGNFYYVKPEMGRYDASRGVVLINDGQGNFRPPSDGDARLNIRGEIRGIVSLGDKQYLLARNNAAPVLVSFTPASAQ
jgi:hypothetical protein